MPIEEQSVAKIVLIIAGSKSDSEAVSHCEEHLSKLGISFDTEYCSAHRDPERTARIASSAENNGYQVVICLAGMSAALPGVVASHTRLPVIGVPLPGSSLSGLDSLLSVVQMPPGIPVAAVAVGKPGAANAAVLAARIVALTDIEVRKKLEVYRETLKQK
jgi:5-(carboxyamino)imidazole ribonucleotide mutase